MREIWQNLFSKGKNTSLKQDLKNVIFAWGVCILWGSIISFLFSEDIFNVTQWFIELPKTPTFLQKAFSSCFLAPIWETAVFIAAPITLLKYFKLKNKDLWMCMIALSAIFGYGHGGIPHVYLQGFFGVMFSWVYLNTHSSFLSTAFVHALWNFSLMWIFQQLV